MKEIEAMTVAVLMGGPGEEREVSLASGRGVCGALKDVCARVIELDIDNDTPELPAGCDLAFNVVHGTFGEDGQLQRVLEQQGVPYTGEGVAASEAAFDKIISKKLFSAAGVNSPEYAIRKPGEALDFDLPCVIKAPRQGSSVGVFIARDEAAAEDALVQAGKLDNEILLEEFVAGRELTVGVLGRETLPVIEIIPQEGFYDFRNKYPFLSPGGGAQHVCPANLSAAEQSAVESIALAACDALNVEVYCRVDVLLPDNGIPSVLEINTIPGMTEASLLPEAAAVAGISYSELCRRIILLSLERIQREGQQV